MVHTYEVSARYLLSNSSFVLHVKHSDMIWVLKVIDYVINLGWEP